jgi:hypothetical protein
VPASSPFPLIDWNSISALDTYAWMILSQHDIDVVEHSQLVGRFSSSVDLLRSYLHGMSSIVDRGYLKLSELQLQAQYSSVSLFEWTTGEETAKYWTSKLTIEIANIDNDRAMITKMTGLQKHDMYSQGFVREDEHRWILISNERHTNVDVLLSECTTDRIQIVNEASSFGPATQLNLTTHRLTCSPFAVAVIHMPLSGDRFSLKMSILRLLNTGAHMIIRKDISCISCLSYSRDQNM